jgi:hypothetical protein
MLRIHEIKLGLHETTAQLPDKIRKRLNQHKLAILSCSIFRESLDARNKEEIKFVYSLDFQVSDERALMKNAAKFKLEQIISTEADLNRPDAWLNGPDPDRQSPACEASRPVVVGFGPCGMFAALRLAELGYRPIVLERGKALSDRVVDVQDFWQQGKLNPESNVAFGEGGAGAFSDGKLTTQIKDPRVRQVLEALVKAGGPPDILYRQKPHIGTDLLRGVVIEIRRKIIALGGEMRFQSRLSGIAIKKPSHQGGNTSLLLKVNDEEEIATGALVLAIGHSARDTIEMLHEAGLFMTQKAFSIGVRVEHKQKLINVAQYGRYAENPRLGAADYKLSHHCEGGRGVYTFCMCPGGLVIGAASEEGRLVTNGMSYHNRAADNANSALLVEVTPEDFPSDHPLSGIAFQRYWEEKAFALGGMDYKAPTQQMGDFLTGRPSSCCGAIKASFQPGVVWTDLSACLPAFAVEALREAIPVLGKKLTGFDDPGTVLTAVETRSSSPVRINRDEGLMSSIPGIFPAGEGAGYAGGIISAAVDGIKAAEAIHTRMSIPLAK